MKRALLFITFFYIYMNSALAYTLRFELKGIFNSKSLSAKDSSGSEGKLVSSSSFDPAFNITYSLADSWKVLFEFYNRTLDFDNTDNIIAGDRMFTATNTQLGIQYILFSTMAFRLIYNNDKEYGFTLNGSNQAVFFEESISYPTLYYDQILYIGEGYYMGLSLGYDISASAGGISNRTGTRFSLYMNYDSFNFFYELRNITKETDEWEYEDQDTLFGLSYILAF